STMLQEALAGGASSSHAGRAFRGSSACPVAPRRTRGKGTMTITGMESPRASRLPPFLVGPVLYIIFTVALVVPVTFILDKAGVPVAILLWGAFAAASLAATIPAHFVRQPGFAAFANLDGSVPPALLVPVLFVAIAPTTLAAGMWSGEGGLAALAAAGMATALLL